MTATSSLSSLPTELLFAILDAGAPVVNASSFDFLQACSQISRRIRTILNDFLRARVQRMDIHGSTCNWELALRFPVVLESVTELTIGSAGSLELAPRSKSPHAHTSFFTRRSKALACLARFTSLSSLSIDTLRTGEGVLDSVTAQLRTLRISTCAHSIREPPPLARFSKLERFALVTCQRPCPCSDPEWSLPLADEDNPDHLDGHMIDLAAINYARHLEVLPALKSLRVSIVLIQYNDDQVATRAHAAHYTTGQWKPVLCDSCCARYAPRICQNQLRFTQTLARRLSGLDTLELRAWFPGPASLDEDALEALDDIGWYDVIHIRRREDGAVVLDRTGAFESS